MKVTTVLTIAMFAIWVSAQGQSVHDLTLDQAVELALKNAEELKNLRLDEEIQVLNNKEITGMTLPQVSASGQASYYTNLPQIQFPTSDFSIYQVLEREGVRDENGNAINVDNATFGTQPVSFVAPWNFQFGLSINQLLFQPDVFIALKAKEAVLQYNRDNIRVSEDKIKEEVQKAYYAVLIAEEQKRIAEGTALRLDQLSAEMTQMYQKGFAEKLDIDKLQVSQNNTKTSINQIVNAINISKALLKNTIGLPITDEINLTEALEPQDLNELLLVSTDSFNYENRSEIILLNSARILQEIDVKRQESAYLPTVAAFYQIQRDGQRNPIFATGGNSPWFWYNTGLIGLSVNQPIFDGFQRKHKVGQAKLKLIKVDNSRIQLKRAIDMEQNIARNSLENAMLNLQVQEANSQLAEEVFEVTQKKYQAGVGSSLEVIQADTELQRAQGSYFQALYDCYVAKIAMNKSLGRL